MFLCTQNQRQSQNSDMVTEPTSSLSCSSFIRVQKTQLNRNAGFYLLLAILDFQNSSNLLYLLRLTSFCALCVVQILHFYKLKICGIIPWAPFSTAFVASSSPCILKMIFPLLLDFMCVFVMVISTYARCCSFKYLGWYHISSNTWCTVLSVQLTSSNTHLYYLRPPEA